MLVIARKIGEQIKVTTREGTIITIKLISIRNQLARIGIDAPDHVVIDREEIVKRKNLEA